MTGTPPAGSGAFGRDLGLFVLAEHADGSVEVALDAGARHEREGDIIHGGVAMTMLDSAMAAAVRRALEPGEWIASVSITTDFLRPATRGRLVARGVLERRGRTMAFPRGELRDAAGDLVARGAGVWAIQRR